MRTCIHEDGSRVNIPAIETGVLPPPDSYLDNRHNNIPPEDGDRPPPPLPTEIDPIWCDYGSSWPYVPDAPGSGSFGSSQPPSEPPSPGFSYQTPRTPSSRRRSATPSHHSSRDGSSRHDTSSGSTSARSRTLTEPGIPASEQEVSRTLPRSRSDGAGARWEYEVTMGDGTMRHRPVSPETRERLWIPLAGSHGTTAGYCPASPSMVSRVMVRRQLLESPLAPKSMAIPQHEIASYPKEWHEGARSSKYSYIPSYQE